MSDKLKQMAVIWKLQKAVCKFLFNSVGHVNNHSEKEKIDTNMKDFMNNEFKEFANLTLKYCMDVLKNNGDIPNIDFGNVLEKVKGKYDDIDLLKEIMNG